MLELSESLKNESKLDDSDARFPEWDFDRSHDGIRGRKPYRCKKSKHQRVCSVEERATTISIIFSKRSGPQHQLLFCGVVALYQTHRAMWSHFLTKVSNKHAKQ